MTSRCFTCEHKIVLKEVQEPSRMLSAGVNHSMLKVSNHLISCCWSTAGCNLLRCVISIICRDHFTIFHFFQDRPRGGDDKDNMTTLLQMFEGLHHPPFLLHPHPYPRPYPHGLQRRGTDETSLLSARRGKEPDFTSQLSSKRNSQALRFDTLSVRLRRNPREIYLHIPTLMGYAALP